MKASQAIAGTLEHGSQIMACGCQNMNTRHQKISGSFRIGPGVAMQSANPLEQHVHGTQVGNEQVGIDVQTLLQRLCANDDPTPGVFSVLAQLGLYLFV